MSLGGYSAEFEQAVDHWDGRYAQPGPWSRARPRGIQVYRNAHVDRYFGRAHPVTPIVWFGPLIVLGLVQGLRSQGVASTAGLFVGGWLIWTLCEYLLHRFVFHRMAHDRRAKRSSFLMHGYHHEFPRDGTRLVAPPAMSWPLGIAFGVLYFLLLGPGFWLALYSGTAAGYVAYDWIHYHTHHGTTRTRVGRFLRRYHLAHHAKAHDAHFGISSPLWDLVFGTYQSRPARSTPEVASGAKP